MGALLEATWLFVILKLVHAGDVATWSWWAVFAPALLWLGLVVIVALYKAIKEA